MKKLKWLLCLPLLLLWSGSWSQNTEHSVFDAHSGANSRWLTYKDNHRALYKIIADEAFRLLDQRAAKVSGLSTAEEWSSWQSQAKSTLRQPLAKFGDTPLNAQSTGTLEREHFIVEKVLFESHPGFYVTAALFIPRNRQQPAPAVIYCSGHTELGFRSETYQHVIINLVEKGFIVLAFDPPGQGERLQYVDPETGKSQIGGPTLEHSYAGVQTLMSGSSLSDYFIHDGIRALDYLETRPEVDMTRIGITGRSGGGTQAAMITACDDRILAAAPENFITSFRRLLQSIGPQDAEQNPWQAIARGIDHPDFLHIHAPKPYLMITTTHDFFSIQGARETYDEARKSYEALGKPGNLTMVEDMGAHQSTINNREALYAFFQKHLNLPGLPTDAEVTPFSYEELLVTPTGQINTAFTAETISSLNRKYFEPNVPAGDNFITQLPTIAGISFDRTLKTAVYTGNLMINDILAEKYFLESNKNDFALPVYFLHKEHSRLRKLIVWLHPQGKDKIIDDPLLTEMLDLGYAVVTADLPGTGELHDPEFTGDGIIRGIPFNYTFGANLAGKSISGIQAEAIDLLMQYVNRHEQLKESDISAIATGNSAVPFLHYACLKNQFSKVAFLNLPETAANLMNKRLYDPEAAWQVVPGSLPVYDMPDLIEALSESGTEVHIEHDNNRPYGDFEGTTGDPLEFFGK